MAFRKLWILCAVYRRMNGSTVVALCGCLLARLTANRQQPIQPSRFHPCSPSFLPLFLPLSECLKAHCGVINAAAAALCSASPRTLYPPHPASSISFSCSVIWRLHIKNLYSLLRFVFELLVLLLFLLVFFLACIRFRKCRIGCVSVGNLQQAGEMDIGRFQSQIARLALPNGAQQPRRRLESASASTSPPTSFSVLGSLTAILFNFPADDTQMIRAQFLAKIAFHLRPKIYIDSKWHANGQQASSGGASNSLPSALGLVISVNMMRMRMRIAATHKTRKVLRWKTPSLLYSFCITEKN